MTRTVKSIITVAALVLFSAMWPQPLRAIDCPIRFCSNTVATECSKDADCPATEVCTNPLVLTSPHTTDLTNPDFESRARDVTLHNACSTPLEETKPSGAIDYGEGYHVKLMARLAFNHYFGTDVLNGRNLLQEAIDSLRALQRGDEHMGTSNEDTGRFTKVEFLDTILDGLVDFFSNANRSGEYDTLMSALVPVLYKYGPRGENRLPIDVYNHVLSLMDLSTGVETFTVEPKPLTLCPLLFALGPVGQAAACSETVACELALATGECTANPLVFAACCVLALKFATIPETENHLNNIYVAQYLTNQLLLDKTCREGSCNTAYDNERNGYKDKMLARMTAFLRNDFIEYNAHNYQDYTVTALLNLASYADNTRVQTAAQSVLDYISAKVAVSSNDGRRSTPFRRKKGKTSPDLDHNCPELIQEHCADPQTGFHMMLAGVTEILPQKPDPRDPTKTVSVAPGYSYEFQWAALSKYRIPDLILDLFVTPAHRNFYQFFHYCNTDCNDELYFGSPSYLISAGGHPTDYAYRADIPFPISLITGRHPGNEDDRGVAVPTVLMPTGEGTSRVDMIRFSETATDFGVAMGGANMCVAPNFACGLNPVIPDRYKNLPPAQFQVDGLWSFIDKSNAPGTFGYYVAVYQNDGFGFLEVYDTKSNPQGVRDFDDFKQRVAVTNNGGRTFAKNTTNNFYRTIDGSLIQFNPDSEIVTINGHPPYDPTRTNGTIINADGQGIVTIDNPSLGQRLTLDGRVPVSPICTPSDQALITLTGAVHFPGTCVGEADFTTLNVCNTGSGNLCVFNILSQNPAFEVTEPISVTNPPAGYPVTISPDFCFPFQAQFAPTTVGAAASTLRLSSSDPHTPFLDVAVTGKGTQPAIRVTGVTAFGDVCGETQTVHTVKVCDVGACNLNVTSAAISCPDFTIVNNPFPAPVSPDFCLDLDIAFTPTSGGSKTCTLTINSNDPTTPAKALALSANTPAVAIDVPPNQAFRPEVIQTVGVCQEQLPFPVSNKGTCNLTITNMTIGGADAGDFAFSGLPSFPLILPAGDVAGEGDLNTVFAPNDLGRARIGSVKVTYVSDPVTGNTTDVTRALCGEGVRTGARVLVRRNGVPVPVVKEIQLKRVGGGGGERPVITHDDVRNALLQTVTPGGACAPFQFHREYGTVGNAVQLLPGAYTVEVHIEVVIGGKKKTIEKTVAFDVGTCNFNPTVIVDF